MTPRERILASISHRPVDRVPIDLGGTRQSGIAAIAYARLRQHLGISGPPPKVFDLFQMLAEIEPAVADRFGADCVFLNRPAVAFGIPNEAWKPFSLFDGTRVLVPGSFNPETDARGDLILRRGEEIIARMPKSGFYFDRLEKYPGALHPDLDAWEPPRLSESDLVHYGTQARMAFEQTEKAVIAAMGPPYELFSGIGQGDFEAWMITFATEPEYVERLYAKLTDAWLDNLAAFRRAVGDHIQILQIADDFGTQNAPFLSPKMFRELVMPAYRRGLDWIHANTPWKVLLHSDGALVPLIPSIIEMGVDILNPVQTTATGMDPARLVAEFGRDLVFWGGSCDCQGTLTSGTPDQIAKEVRRNLGAFRPLDGGHVFASVHNIQANVPPANIVALFDAAL